MNRSESLVRAIAEYAIGMNAISGDRDFTHGFEDENAKIGLSGITESSCSIKHLVSATFVPKNSGYSLTEILDSAAKHQEMQASKSNPGAFMAAYNGFSSYGTIETTVEENSLFRDAQSIAVVVEQNKQLKPFVDKGLTKSVGFFGAGRIFGVFPPMYNHVLDSLSKETLGLALSVQKSDVALPTRIVWDAEKDFDMRQYRASQKFAYRPAA
jgi:hypothetical protein